MGLFDLTHTYDIWQAMRSRCTKPHNPKYHRYGGRGITVCERWQDFKNFLADMGERPEGMQLDRKDNDGPYSPDNCRWATPQEQMNNTSFNVFIEHDGRKLTISQWARELNIKPNTIVTRLRRGWQSVDALSALRS
jgi:hypothetical protein